MRHHHARLLTLALLAVLGGCTRLLEWRPIHTGDPGNGDDLEIVQDDVTLRAHRFGLWNSHRPELALELRNGGAQPVRFDPGACRLEAEGQLLAPVSDHVAATIAPGQRARWTIDFPRIELPTEPVHSAIFGDGRRISTQSLRVDLGVLWIDERAEMLPLLEYANPWLD